MNRKAIKKTLRIAAAILMLIFIIKTALDYPQYLKSFGSAPFSVWIMMYALYFLLPSAILFIISLCIKKKN
ncbi:MAG: hypothetical protein IJJ00_01625 [Erysipelotrichaceae bacterium]|nr:hypothetical protein [Erysipelotrichaceae bacterium]